MDTEKKHHSNGFFIGLVLGALLAVLFTTKKGREILTMLTTQGAEKMQSWKSVLDADESLEKEDETDYLPESEKNPTSGRRFFRRQTKG